MFKAVRGVYVLDALAVVGPEFVEASLVASILFWGALGVAIAAAYFEW